MGVDEYLYTPLFDPVASAGAVRGPLEAALAKKLPVTL